LVLIPPLDNLLTMTVLKYPSVVRLPSCFSDETELSPQIGQEESSLAEALVEAHTCPFDVSQYTDQYTVKLEQLIDAKANGKAIQECQLRELIGYRHQVAQRWSPTDNILPHIALSQWGSKVRGPTHPVALQQRLGKQSPRCKT
jgi:hypothetical protein